MVWINKLSAATICIACRDHRFASVKQARESLGAECFCVAQQRLPLQIVTTKLHRNIEMYQYVLRAPDFF